MSRGLWRQKSWETGDIEHLQKVCYQLPPIRRPTNNVIVATGENVDSEPECDGSYQALSPNSESAQSCRTNKSMRRSDIPVLSSRPSSHIPDSPSVEKSKRMNNDNSASEQSFIPAENALEQEIGIVKQCLSPVDLLPSLLGDDFLEYLVWGNGREE
jgi:hypothetical protein